MEFDDGAVERDVVEACGGDGVLREAVGRVGLELFDEALDVVGVECAVAVVVHGAHELP